MIEDEKGRHYCPHCMEPVGAGDEHECWMYSDSERRSSVGLPGCCLTPGTNLSGGKYIIGDVLGEGGFGITYVARETLIINGPVVVKEYFPAGSSFRDTSSPTGDNVICTGDTVQFVRGKERFLEEARKLYRLEEVPGMVRVRDFIEANNTAYIVMDLVKGGDLRNEISTKPLDAQDAFRKMLPIAEVLRLVNARGIVHRDVSPDNIKVCGDALALIDFGAARYTNAFDGRNMTTMYKEGYAAPEQYRIDGCQGAWTDIYGFCATLYACITGKGPLESPQRMKADTVLWPSQLCIDIDEGLEGILKKGMSLDHGQRYQSFAELICAIKEELRPEPVDIAGIATGTGDFAQEAGLSTGVNQEGPTATDAVRSTDKPIANEENAMFETLDEEDQLAYVAAMLATLDGEDRLAIVESMLATFGMRRSDTDRMIGEASKARKRLRSGWHYDEADPCELPLIDVSDVEDMGGMFGECSSLRSVDLSRWNTSKVESMRWMFYSCSNLVSLDLSHWDVSRVTNMSNMFAMCSKLERLNLSSWDVSNVEDMRDMFYGCERLEELDLSGWNVPKTANTTDMFIGLPVDCIVKATDPKILDSVYLHRIVMDPEFFSQEKLKNPERIKRLLDQRIV